MPLKWSAGWTRSYFIRSIYLGLLPGTTTQVEADVKLKASQVPKVKAAWFMFCMARGSITLLVAFAIAYYPQRSKQTRLRFLFQPIRNQYLHLHLHQVRLDTQTLSIEYIYIFFEWMNDDLFPVVPESVFLVYFLLCPRMMRIKTSRRMNISPTSAITTRNHHSS